MKRARLNAKQRFDAATVLARVCKPDGEYCVYDEGWDDRKVSVEVTGSASFEAAIARIRVEALGRIERKSKKNSFEEEILGIYNTLQTEQNFRRDFERRWNILLLKLKNELGLKNTEDLIFK